MTRTTLAIVLVMTAVFTVCGQGRVNFNNYVSGNAITVASFNQGPTGGNPGDFIGADYSIEILWAPGIFHDWSQWYVANKSKSTPTAFFGTTGGSPATDGAGLFDGGSVSLEGPAGTYTMQVRAWFNGGRYATYQAAEAARVNVGSSVLFTVNATAAPSPPTNTVFPAFEVRIPCIGPYFAPFTIQPTDQAVTPGDTAAFYVTFPSYPPCPFPAYQWYFNGSPDP